MNQDCSTIYEGVIPGFVGPGSMARERLGHQVAAVPGIGNEHVPWGVPDSKCRT